MTPSLRLPPGGPASELFTKSGTLEGGWGGRGGSDHFLGLVLDPEELLEDNHRDKAAG